jgi:hypothetical protein
VATQAGVRANETAAPTLAGAGGKNATEDRIILPLRLTEKDIASPLCKMQTQ